jgi:hypothetical protein
LVDFVRNISQHDLHSQRCQIDMYRYISESRSRIPYCSSNIDSVANPVNVNMVMMACGIVIGRSADSHSVLTAAVRVTVAVQGSRTAIAAGGRQQGS